MTLRSRPRRRAEGCTASGARRNGLGANWEHATHFGGPAARAVPHHAVTYATAGRPSTPPSCADCGRGSHAGSGLEGGCVSGAGSRRQGGRADCRASGGKSRGQGGRESRGQGDSVSRWPGRVESDRDSRGPGSREGDSQSGLESCGPGSSPSDLLSGSESGGGSRSGNSRGACVLRHLRDFGPSSAINQGSKADSI
jgi:hypothetical protein